MKYKFIITKTEKDVLNGFDAFLLKHNLVFIDGWDFYKDLKGGEFSYTDIWVKYTRSVNYTF